MGLPGARNDMWNWLHCPWTNCIILEDTNSVDFDFGGVLF